MVRRAHHQLVADAGVACRIFVIVQHLRGRPLVQVGEGRMVHRLEVVCGRDDDFVVAQLLACRQQAPVVGGVTELVLDVLVAPLFVFVLLVLIEIVFVCHGSLG